MIRGINPVKELHDMICFCQTNLGHMKEDQIVPDNRLPVYCRHLFAATSYCDPGRHANVITPCLLTPCLNVPNPWPSKARVFSPQKQGFFSSRNP